MITHAPEPRLEPYTDFIQTDEPEPITDYDLEIKEQEYALSLSDEEICRIYEELGL